MRSEMENKMLKLYNRGLNDTEIGRRLGISKKTVLYFRRKRGLKPNAPSKRPLMSPEKEEKRLKLYRLGLSDDEIASRLGLHRDSIRHWRERRGLSSTHPENVPFLYREKTVERSDTPDTPRLPTKKEVLNHILSKGRITTHQLFLEGFGDVERGFDTIGKLGKLAGEGKIKRIVRHNPHEIIWLAEKRTGLKRKYRTH